VAAEEEERLREAIADRRAAAAAALADVADPQPPTADTYIVAFSLPTGRRWVRGFPADSPALFLRRAAETQEETPWRFQLLNINREVPTEGSVRDAFRDAHRVLLLVREDDNEVPEPRPELPPVAQEQPHAGPPPNLRGPV
jgi:hypothetical protein